MTWNKGPTTYDGPNDFDGISLSGGGSPNANFLIPKGANMNGIGSIFVFLIGAALVWWFLGRVDAFGVGVVPETDEGQGSGAAQ